ncbi:MAG: hypothetical protein QM781_15035 [Chitinophagaceae bacterium]
MKIEIFRLISIDPNGIGNRGNGLLNIIYSYLLWKNGLDYYRFIKVNQIGREQQVKEFVEIDKGYVHINLIYPTDKDFNLLDDDNKNKIRLEVAHAGLLRLAEVDSRFSISKLNKIHEEVIKNNFQIALESDGKINQFDKGVLVKLLILPSITYFDYHLIIQRDGAEICRQFLYRGKPAPDIVTYFFSKPKWKNKNELVIEGEEKQMRLRLNISNCNLEFQNLTQYPSPPLWEMMKVGISEQESKSAYENWLHSLPPAVAAMIRDHEN